MFVNWRVLFFVSLIDCVIVILFYVYISIVKLLVDAFLLSDYFILLFACPVWVFFAFSCRCVPVYDPLAEELSHRCTVAIKLVASWLINTKYLLLFRTIDTHHNSHMGSVNPWAMAILKTITSTVNWARKKWKRLSKYKHVYHKQSSCDKQIFEN